MQTTTSTTAAEKIWVDVIGRSKTGDQLHLCCATLVGNELRGGLNAHCNNHMHLRPVLGFKGEKHTIKARAGLFCVKCFGADASRIVAREFANAIVVAA